ncbi:MAG: glycoside hydrolase family 2 TIM barrel-domain containing protein [Verrucomicrobiota bacterium]
MKNAHGKTDTLSRRSFLGQAVAATSVLSVLGSAGLANGQAQPAGTARREPRIRDSFDFDWRFFKGDAQGAQEPDFADANWRVLDLPHDWSIEEPFSGLEGSETVRLPTGIGWYRKHFSLPESYRDRKVIIEFDGVYQNSEVWINGQYLGKRPYGFISFSYDLTARLKFGGDNVIAVKADNSRQPNCRWYSGSGIYRHTWLLVTSQLHVACWGTFVTMPQVDMNSATIQIKTRIQNEGPGDAQCTLATSIVDREGKVIQTAEATQSIVANGGEHEFVQRVQVAQPNLWSPDHPYLYKVRSTARDQDRVVDQYDTVVGIRGIEFDANKGFLLNGKQVKLNGVCLHHDCGAVGAAVPERVWQRRLEILKAMGCNAIRTSHNPYSSDFMDLCDRLGFLVMNEVFDEWKQSKTANGYGQYFDEWSERDVTSFVHRDRNRPSVVLWSAGNEISEDYLPAGVETLRKLVEIFHREDPSRFVTAASWRIARAAPRAVSQEYLQLQDVVGYNYGERGSGREEKYYSVDHHDYPQRRFIGTEDASMAIAAPSRDDPERGGVDCFRPDVEQLWKFVRTNDYVCGDFMWTGIDYLVGAEFRRRTGPSGATVLPGKNSSCGELNTCGFEKDGYYFYQSQWTDKPMVHLFPHWNWKGREAEFIPVLCYTNCDTVELFLNGKSLGVQGCWFPRVEPFRTEGRSRAARTTSDLHLTWTVPYQPGTLKAVGTKDGKVVAEAEVATTGEPAAVGLSVDRDAIVADRRDVAHVTVKILDAQGRLVPAADNEVAFELRGEGRIIGLDNGNPASYENFKGDRRKAFQGMCMAIVQSTAKPGRIQLTATSSGLKSNSVSITSSEA